ncbi:unnamed protein product [Musa acuminata subsp. malaccensis]|uniref:(wild Malaysian banana) hypothetical protein n=1 Tax=Musa acuminata subsp. malaccensis TaxID=214687 RepID=A0A804JIC2_MUSAM|nr:unnamed protein product [Musa acuminata subsp. malaccensis]
MVGPATDPRTTRSVLSSVNGGPNSGDQAAAGSDGGSASGIEFSSREDVERLLAEKMKVKTKNDFKGKSEQMIEYIKKFRICIRWYMELEDGYLAEQGKLRNMLESEEKRHREIESRMRAEIDELDATIRELQDQNSSLQENLVNEETEKLVAIKSYENERQTRVAVENSQDALSLDLQRVNQENKRLSDQLKLLQETNRRLQEYNTSLQQYNSNL